MNERIKKATRAVKAAEAAQAVGAEYAPETVEIGGVKFWMPTLAHVWAVERLRVKVQGYASLIDFGVIVVCLLGHDSGEVRNRLLAMISRGDIDQYAFGWVIDHQLDEPAVNQVLDEVAEPVFCFKKKADQMINRPPPVDWNRDGGRQ